MNQKIRRGLQAGLFVALILATVSGLSAPTQGQESIHRAEAVVLVNSASSNYTDFAQYIRPYLDHFGIPYTVLDIASAPVTSSIAEYALIIIGHRNLDPSHLYLDSTEQSIISAAVFAGTGLVNFDNVLVSGIYTPLYTYVQDIFRFGYASSTPGAQVQIHTGIGSPLIN